MHSIIICIRCHDYLVVTKPFKAISQTKSSYEISQFYVFKDFSLTAPITVLGLPTDAEYSLINWISCLRNSPTCRLPLRAHPA